METQLSMFKPESRIGLKIQYNKDITAIVLNEDKTHVLIKTDKGSKFCVLKSSIEWDELLITF